MRRRERPDEAKVAVFTTSIASGRGNHSSMRGRTNPLHDGVALPSSAVSIGTSRPRHEGSEERRVEEIDGAATDTKVSGSTIVQWTRWGVSGVISPRIAFSGIWRTRDTPLSPTQGTAMTLEKPQSAARPDKLVDARRRTIGTAQTASASSTTTRVFLFGSVGALFLAPTRRR
jgi:hypothetical protein